MFSKCNELWSMPPIIWNNKKTPNLIVVKIHITDTIPLLFLS